MNDYGLNGSDADFDSPYTDYHFDGQGWREIDFRYADPAYKLVNLTTEQEAKVIVDDACNLWYIRNNPKKYGMESWML